MSEWVLVPPKLTDAMSYSTASSAAYDPSEDWIAMLAARPPIPRDVWNAMVERGARGVLEAELWPGAYKKAPEAEQNYARYKAEAALRAALGDPVVEGDEL